MTPERWARIRQIFDDAVERPKEDRYAYVQSLCGDDAELLGEVRSLLSSHDGSGDFLQTPAANLNKVFASSSSFATIGETDEFPISFRVGPYQLEKRLGRGGMGTVWLAARVDHEFEKKVAVKMVKRGMDTQEILRRFRLERQVLAGLEQANIARLIDGGSTPDGLPYLVMEYVEGTRIDHYCESRQATISERLKLFRDVCAAVQYAHQNLVVHRDIKASNILVTPEGVPKLLDFGIAKLLRTDFTTQSSIDTRTELRPMTLDYASPEQVKGEPITTATDIYSLGVLLYKLLTTRFPYGLDATRSTTALQKAICEMEPLRPSSVILASQEPAIPLATQRIEIGEETREKARKRLKGKLSGDLDVIILKALRKEPLRRYASAEQFSDDIRRYLEGRPVTARRDTFGYRASKFLGRNPVGAFVGVATGLALLGGSVWSGLSAYQAKQRLTQLDVREAAREPELVQTSLQLASLLESSDPTRAAALYRQALAASRELVRAQPAQIVFRLDLANAAMKLGDLAPSEAVERYQDALTNFEAGAQGLGLDGQRKVMTAAQRLGIAQSARGDRLAALASLSRALQIAEGLVAGNPHDREALLAAASCNVEVGKVLAKNGEKDAALSKFRKASQYYQELGGPAPPELRREMDSVGGR